MSLVFGAFGFTTTEIARLSASMKIRYRWSIRIFVIILKIHKGYKESQTPSLDEKYTSCRRRGTDKKFNKKAPREWRVSGDPCRRWQRGFRIYETEPGYRSCGI